MHCLHPILGSILLRLTHNNLNNFNVFALEVLMKHKFCRPQSNFLWPALMTGMRLD